MKTAKDAAINMFAAIKEIRGPILNSLLRQSPFSQTFFKNLAHNFVHEVILGYYFFDSCMDQRVNKKSFDSSGYSSKF